jgi:hypothetical protein
MLPSSPGTTRGRSWSLTVRCVDPLDDPMVLLEIDHRYIVRLLIADKDKHRRALACAANTSSKTSIGGQRERGRERTDMMQRRLYAG